MKERKKMNISREELKEYMNYIIQKKEADSKIHDIAIADKNVSTDRSICTELIVGLLEAIFQLPVDEMSETTLAWWMYEKDYGKKFKIGDLEYTNLPEDHKLRKPDLSNLDGLYDCLVLEWNSGKYLGKKYA